MAFDFSPLWISLKSAALATAITFFLGIAAARWMLVTRIKGKAIIEGLFIAPLVLPPTVLGFLLLLLFGRNGPVGQFLLQFGLTVIFSWPATVITATVVAFPLMYKTALGAFEQIDPNLLHAARTLGASEWTVFWRVMVPLAHPGIVAGTILAFTRGLGEFGATLMLAGNIPGQTQTVPMAIYFAVEAGEMKLASIWVLIILGISLSVLTAVNYWSASGRRLAAGGSGEAAAPIAKQPPATPLEPATRDRQPSEIGLFADIEKPLSSFPLEVELSTEGKVLGLLGASGSGKSMTLRCIAGLETPRRGKIVLNRRVLFDSEQRINLPSRERRIGFLFQNYALFPHLTVAQNIAFGLPKGRPSSTINQEVQTQLAAFQLQGLENRYPHQLSGGQQQRVALARALASQPEALLLDEPFSALDTHLRSQLEKQLISLLATYRGVTFFVTHNLEEAYRVCQNLLVIERGKAVAYGSKHSIFERPPTFSVAQLTGCKNFSSAVATGTQQIEATDWGCTLQVIEPIPDNLSCVGIRAHQLSFPNESSQENTFPCWLAATSETPHRMTLYLKLHHPPASDRDYHLQAEVFKEKWADLKDRPFPWQIHLHPLRLLLLRE